MQLEYVQTVHSVTVSGSSLRPTQRNSVSLHGMKDCTNSSAGQLETRTSSWSALRRADETKFVDRTSCISLGPERQVFIATSADILEGCKVLFRYNHGVKSQGSLKVTPFYLRISCGPLDTVSVHIFLGEIDSIRCISAPENKHTLRNVTVDCKTFQRLELFQVPKALSDSIESKVFFMSLSPESIPAFQLPSYVPESAQKLIPWSTSYLGQSQEERDRLAQSGWKVDVTSNEGYKLCDTYPRQFVVPMKSDDALLKSASMHRTSQRIPVLSWLHTEKCAAICRSSQPRTGMTNRKSIDDNNVLRNILATSKADLPVDDKLMIFDARPWVNATVCHATGGGVENFDSKYRYCGIENIHEVRKSHKKLRKVCMRYHKFASSSPVSEVEHFQTTSFMDDYKRTRWSKHLKTIMKAAVKVVESVSSGFTVLIHCSDGWDRTAQITSLAMLLLESEFRTSHGFMQLIEREWCNMGHKFATRLGHGVRMEREKEEEQRAPIFLQFIECVWRIQQIWPYFFQFNEDFLITLLRHSYSCCFGNFLYDCERERLATFQKTFSLWNYLSSHEAAFTNFQYDPHRQPDEDYSDSNGITQWNAILTHFKEQCNTLFWSRWYLCYQNGNIHLKNGTLPDLDMALGVL